MHSFKRNQKIFWGYSFEHDMLIFSCHTIKFHYCHHINQTWGWRILIFLTFLGPVQMSKVTWNWLSSMYFAWDWKTDWTIHDRIKDSFYEFCALMCKQKWFWWSFSKNFFIFLKCRQIFSCTWRARLKIRSKIHFCSGVLCILGNYAYPSFLMQWWRKA